MLARALDGGSSSGTGGWAELSKAGAALTSPITTCFHAAKELGWASAKSTSRPPPHLCSVTASDSILTHSLIKRSLAPIWTQPCARRQKKKKALTPSVGVQAGKAFKKG